MDYGKERHMRDGCSEFGSGVVGGFSFDRPRVITMSEGGGMVCTGGVQDYARHTFCHINLRKTKSLKIRMAPKVKQWVI